MTSILKLTGILLMFLFISCTNSPNNFSSDWTGKEANTDGQQYTLDDLEMSIGWTAYKFTDKISVAGTFQDYTLNMKNSSGSIEKILSGLQMSIPTESIVTTNAIQDFKIKTYFFKAFNTPTITGTVINANDKSGEIMLKMNNMSYKIPFSYFVENDIIVLTTQLDLKRWKGEEAIAELDKEWYGFLDQEDGMAKLWPEVDVVIKLPVNKMTH